MFLRSNRLNQNFHLPKGHITVGRSPDCQIILEPQEVSKQHLQIRCTDDLVEVKDLGRNPTKINQKAIDGLGWVALKHHDLIDICGFDFRLLMEDEPSGVSGSCIVENGGSDSALSSRSRSISLSQIGLTESRQFTQLRALLAMANTLRDVLKTEDVLERAVSILFEILPGIDRAAICFINEDKVLQPKWWGVRERRSDETIRVSQNIGRHVAETAEAVITSDAMEDFGDAQSVYAASMRSVMCCPLVDPGDEVFGMIHVDSNVPNMFNQIDLEVLAAVALQIGLAINCSRLHSIALADELLRKDIQRARDVQHRYLPTAPPAVDGFELAGFYRAAYDVGGDYYDYARLPDGRLAIVLGDVVGKGVPAALTMVRIATETRAGLEVCKSPSELLARLNLRLQDDFITLVAMFLDPATSKITLSNAGHEPPMLRSVDGTVKPIGFDLSGCPIGVLEDGDYQNTQLVLAPGESLLVFSDGFPDAEQRGSEQRFGSDAISQILGNVNGPASQIIETIVAKVDRFTEDSPQFDDMCMVCLRRTPA